MSLTKRMMEEQLDREPVVDQDDDSLWDRVRAVHTHTCDDCNAKIEVGAVFMRNRDSEQLWHEDCFELHQGFLYQVNKPNS